MLIIALRTRMSKRPEIGSERNRGPARGPFNFFLRRRPLFFQLNVTNWLPRLSGTVNSMLSI
jgi:hypothetical protein